MPRKLEWSDVHEVSVVDAGANLKGRFPITKKADMTDLKETLEAALETPVEGEAEIEKHAGSEDEKQALVALYRFADACGIDKSIFADSEDDEAEVELEAEENELAKAIEQEENEEMNEDIQKQFESLQKQLETEREAREAVEAKLEKAKDDAELAQWVGKCKENLQFVPGDFADLAKNLHEVAKLNPELADDQYARLCETNALLEKSDAFKSVGTAGRNETSKEDMVAKRAAELKGEGLSAKEALIKAAIEAEKN